MNAIFGIGITNCAKLSPILVNWIKAGRKKNCIRFIFLLNSSRNFMSKNMLGIHPKKRCLGEKIQCYFNYLLKNL